MALVKLYLQTGRKDELLLWDDFGARRRSKKAEASEGASALRKKLQM